MRALSILASALTLALAFVPSVTAEPGGECGRGPYESVLPADGFCCAFGFEQWCFLACKVWVRNPATGGFLCLEDALVQ